jgi:hypothetical protein
MMTLNLTVDQINIILNALGNAPYITVAPVIAEIQKQAQPQIDLPTTQAAAQAARDAERQQA